MARKKKNDFWDEADAPVVTAESEEQDDKSKKDKKAKQHMIEDEEWSATKSTPIKVIMRLLLMISCLVALASGYIAYEYVGDRYANGTYSTEFFDSKSFATEFNKSVDQILQLVQAMEADPDMTKTGNEELLATQVENYMGKDSNFAFMIQDGEHYELASSGDDAKDRIESSEQYALITNANGEISISSTISGSLLNKAEWEKILSQTSNSYIIYASVDNELLQKDNFFNAKKNFEQMEEYFTYARLVGIVAVVLFIICLIFCIMATGMKRGYANVCLSWFDYIPTELALAIMGGVGYGIYYGINYVRGQDGTNYQYVLLALLVVMYIWVIRCYFSIVRRIKGGRLLRHSIIGEIIAFFGRAIGGLPKPLNYILGGLIIIAINGGVIYSLIFYRQYTYNGIPIVFPAAIVVFIIELLSLLVHSGNGDYDELPDDPDDIKVISEKKQKNDDTAENAEAAESTVEEEAAEAAENQEIEAAQIEASVEEQAVEDWQELDLGSEVVKTLEAAAAEKAAQEKALSATNPNTVVLSDSDMQKALREAGLETEEVKTEEVKLEDKAVQEETVIAPAVTDMIEEADDGRVNFVQLNKDVRKIFKPSLKKTGNSITVRAPEKPVVIDIDRNSLKIIVNNIFSQIETFTKPNEKTYAEVYLQGGKVVYIVRIPVREDAMEAAGRAAAGDETFQAARKIVEANDGRFIVTLDGDLLKVGMLIDAAN